MDLSDQRMNPHNTETKNMIPNCTRSDNGHRHKNDQSVRTLNANLNRIRLGAHLKCTISMSTGSPAFNMTCELEVMLVSVSKTCIGELLKAQLLMSARMSVTDSELLGRSLRNQ